MIITVHGKTIARNHGLSLVEYSTGDHPESYYKVLNTKTREEVSSCYLLPNRNHRKALKWFKECIAEYTK